MPLKGDTGLKIPRQYLQQVAKKFPEATAKAMRDTLFDVRTGLYQEMEDSFEPPVHPYLLPRNPKKPGKRGALFVEYDLKRFEGRVYAKDRSEGSALTAEDILLPHITGQDREFKRSEKSLYRAGILPKGWYAIPGEAIRRDKYGNISRGQMTQMLSYLQANPDAAQNTTKNSMAKKKQRYSYFVSRDKNGRPFGIRKRTGKHKVEWFLIFAESSKYYPVYEFQKAGELTIRRQWPKNFAFWRKQIFDQRRRKVAA